MTFSFSFRSHTKLDAHNAVDTAAKPNLLSVPQADKIIALVRGMIDAQPQDDDNHMIDVIGVGHVDLTGRDSEVTIKVTRPLVT